MSIITDQFANNPNSSEPAALSAELDGFFAELEGTTLSTRWGEIADFNDARNKSASAAVKWVTGQNWVDGAVAWSPITGITYKTNKALTNDTADPSSNPTDWDTDGDVPSATQTQIDNISITGPVDFDSVATGATYTADGTITAGNLVGLDKTAGTVTTLGQSKANPSAAAANEMSGTTTVGDHTNTGAESGYSTYLLPWYDTDRNVVDNQFALCIMETFDLYFYAPIIYDPDLETFSFPAAASFIGNTNNRCTRPAYIGNNATDDQTYMMIYQQNGNDTHLYEWHVGDTTFAYRGATTANLFDYERGGIISVEYTTNDYVVYACGDTSVQEISFVETSYSGNSSFGLNKYNSLLYNGTGFVENSNGDVSIVSIDTGLTLTAAVRDVSAGTTGSIVDLLNNCLMPGQPLLIDGDIAVMGATTNGYDITLVAYNAVTGALVEANTDCPQGSGNYYAGSNPNPPIIYGNKIFIPFIHSTTTSTLSMFVWEYDSVSQSFTYLEQLDFALAGSTIPGQAPPFQKINDDTWVACIQINDATSDYQLLTFKPSLNNLDTFVGIAQATVADGESVAVKGAGLVDENQSGLTLHNTYYLADDGSLTGTVTSTPVGVAVATDALYITGGS